jgi:hypothetical protein
MKSSSKKSKSGKRSKTARGPALRSKMVDSEQEGNQDRENRRINQKER